MNINNFGPKSMGVDLAKQVKDLGKLDEKKGVGEAQEATAADRPEGDTDVNKTVIVNNKDGGYEVKYDGVDDGIVIELVDGKFDRLYVDDGHHNFYRDQGEGFHPYPTEE